MDVQCKDYTGNFQNMPSVFGDRSQWLVENDHLRAHPFNLRTGDDVVCQVRSVNRCDVSAWSPMSQRQPLQECIRPIAEIPNEPTVPIKCGFACAIKTRNCSGKQCGDVLSRQEILAAADHVILANN